MFRRIGRLLFLSAVFVSGVLIGGIYTPEIIAQSNVLDAHENIEKQDIQKKTKPLQKRLRRSKQLV